MKERKQKLLILSQQLKKLNSGELQYIKGWLDAKLEK